MKFGLISFHVTCYECQGYEVIAGDTSFNRNVTDPPVAYICDFVSDVIDR